MVTRGKSLKGEDSVAFRRESQPVKLKGSISWIGIYRSIESIFSALVNKVGKRIGEDGAHARSKLRKHAADLRGLLTVRQRFESLISFGLHVLEDGVVDKMLVSPDSWTPLAWFRKSVIIDSELPSGIYLQEHIQIVDTTRSQGHVISSCLISPSDIPVAFEAEKVIPGIIGIGLWIISDQSASALKEFQCCECLDCTRHLVGQNDRGSFTHATAVCLDLQTERREIPLLVQDASLLMHLIRSGKFHAEKPGRSGGCLIAQGRASRKLEV